MIRDAAFLMVILFMVGIGLLVVFMVMDGLNDAIQDAPFFAAEDKAVMQDQYERFHSVWDYVFLVAYIGSVLGVLALSYALRTNPVVFFAVFVVMVVVIGVSGYFANAWDDFTGSGVLAAAAAEFPIMDYMITNYLLFVLVPTFLMLVVFFAKPTEAPL